MKVTFCAYELEGKVGGPMSWIARLLPFLVDKGWSVQLLLFSDYKTRSPMASELERRAIDVRLNSISAFTKQKVLWIFEQIRSDPPDVFVPNLVVPAYMAAAWLRKSGIPTVAVLHSDDRFYRSIQDQFIFGSAFFRVSAVVCVSQYLEESVKSRAPSAAVRRIPYGVTVPRSQGTVHQGVFRVVYVGRLVQEQKRITELTKALCLLVQRVEGVEATIIGDGQDRTAVEAILAEFQNPATVKLRGAIPNQEVQKELCEHHAVVLLSDYEGLPIALLEAMACGLVPICLDMRSGIPELVQHGINGVIVADRGESFFKAVKELRDDGEYWERLSHAARQTVIERFSEASSFHSWHEFLVEQAIESNRSSVLKLPGRFVLPPVDSVLAREDFRGESRSRLPGFLQLPVHHVKNKLRALAVRIYRP